MQLTERMKQLISLLSKFEGIQSGNFLAEHLNVSTRTIRNDITSINNFKDEIGCEIISVVGRGYNLVVSNEESFKKIFSSETKSNNYIHDRLKQELLIIIKNTLTITNFTYIQIINQLNISEATLNKDVMLLKSTFKNTNISIVKNKNNILVFEGDEIEIRNELTHILNKDFNDFLRDDKSIVYEIFDVDKIDFIKKSLKIRIEENNYQLSDELFALLVLHIAIGLYRPSVNFEKFIDGRSVHVYQMIQKCLKDIDDLYNSSLLDDSWYYTRMVLTMNNMVHQNVDNTIYTNLETVIVDSLKNIQDKTGYTFLLDSILINGLVLHLNSLFERQKFNIRFHNQTLDVVKLHYTMAYEIAIIFSNEMKDKLDIEFDESEIGLIAIHFGGSLERLEHRSYKTNNVVIVCGYGIATAMLIKERLKSEFGNQIKIEAILNSNELKDYNLSNIDFIFTTIPLDIQEQHKVVNVDIALSNSNIKTIEKQLNQNGTYELLLDLFSSENFFKNVLVQSADQAINWIGEKMVSNGSIESEHVNEVKKREAISSTEVGNLVAIPHCFNSTDNKSSIGVMTLEKPITWKKEKVQLIFFIVLAQDKKPIWESVFRLLYPFITNEERVKKVINEYDFEKLLSSISNLNKED